MSHRSTDLTTPVAPRERIAALDVVRGFAVLGILVMNIGPMALPRWASTETYREGGLDLAVWYVQDALFDGRMRALFSMMFGAGVWLLLRRLESRGEGLAAADLHVRRMLWLVLFGLVHAWVLLWPGDILYSYGILGLALVPFRSLRPRTLAIAGLAVLSLGTPLAFWDASDSTRKWDDAATAHTAREAGEDLTDEQTAALEWREERLERRDPPAEKRAALLTERRAGYADIWLVHAPGIVESQTQSIFQWDVVDGGGMMLLGMGLAAAGFFTGSWRRRSYLALVVAGYGFAVPFAFWQASAWVAGGARPDDVPAELLYMATYHPMRLIVALAHASVLVLLVTSGRCRALTSRLAATGRMALTHYVTHTVIGCLLLFGPVGKLYGELTRTELMLVVAAVWSVQLWISGPWLARFRYGPLEWLWRSLTYARRQPLRRAASTPAAVELAA